MCTQCRKSVKDELKCAKCAKAFHPSCLLQAASAKNAVCKHSAVAAVKVDDGAGSTVQRKFEDRETERQLLLKLIGELEEKNSILRENCELLRERVHYLERSRGRTVGGVKVRVRS